MARPDGYPAFPTGYGGKNHPGMTLRDHFAGQAIAPIIALLGRIGDGDVPWELVAKSAYGLADAMLAERNKEPGK